MGVWSVAILDSGVTDEAEAIMGPNLYEYDFYYGHPDTDGWRTTTINHGSVVAAMAEETNPALERLDLKVSDDYGGGADTLAIRNALTEVANLHDQGWQIGAVNMSLGGPDPSVSAVYQSQIDALAARGIYSVAASGNTGHSSIFENADYPAALPNVISVGSHDGAGNPSGFSQNSSTAVDILANGELARSFDPNEVGTSYAAPMVSATVTTVQALVEGVTSDRLSFDAVVDALQLGGAGPRSSPDPADGATTYFLHDHAGTVSYTLSTHIDPFFNGLEYIASYGDLEAAFGRDAGAAREHYINLGVYEGRAVGLDGLEYIASHVDLIGAFGANRAAGAQHFLDYGRAEGRSTTFDADAYMAAHADLTAAFAGNDDLAAAHYIIYGYAEGRATGGGFAAAKTKEPAAVEGDTTVDPMLASALMPQSDPFGLL